MPSLILNFHGVGAVPRPLDGRDSLAWLDVEFFEAVLDLVRGNSRIGLTVDDGNASDVDFIAPALTKRSLRATFFVSTGRLGRPGFLDREQLRELRSAGMAIGSHGVDHVSWRGLPTERLRRELETSRTVLGEACGVPVDEAACPYGAYDRRVLAAIKRAGYRRVYTSDGGFCDPDRWILPRTTVTRSMSLDDVRALLEARPGYLRRSAVRAKMFVKRLR